MGVHRVEGSLRDTATTTRGTLSLVGPGEWAARRQSAALEVLKAQADAAGRADSDGFLQPVAASEKAAAQVRFQRMADIGVEGLTLVSVDEVAPPVPAAPGTEVTWDVEATYDYRIRGFDRGPRGFVLSLSLRAAPSTPERLRISASQPLERPQPWDIEEMQVRRSPRSLVVGSPAGADLDEVLARAERATDVVAGVWGSAIPAVWIVPSDASEAERLLGRRQGELDEVAAATDGPLEAGAPARADRIVLNPQAWSALTPVGRDVVMRHELTHTAVRATTARPVPPWLSEGLAEYVAYKDVDVDDHLVAASLLERLGRERLPAHLPGPERFDPGAGPLSATYAESWLAVRTLVRIHGQAAVVALYQEAAQSGPTPTAPDPESALDDALTRLGTTRVELERLWRGELRRLSES